ncbi:MAG: hypothetical protein ABI693_23560 [Bryobacteraceae bacterium]
MSVQSDLSRLSVGEFADRFRPEMIPLSNKFSYFFAAPPLSEDDIKEYLEDPITALPLSVVQALPKISILLVPYLERVNGTKGARPIEHFVTLEKPHESRSVAAAQIGRAEESVIAFAIKDQEVADYHYRFYHMLAEIIVRFGAEEAMNQYSSLLRDELNSGVHGEVDEQSWHLKQSLLRRQTNVRRETKAFREYATQSFVDTMTLYLHGICCDIDVETGPRQLPSRHLRRRLDLVYGVYPPPTGYAVFPEDLNTK